MIASPNAQRPNFFKANANVLGLIAAFVVVYLLFGFLVPNGRFLGIENIELLLRQSTIVACVALGMTYVIVGGGIDLSVGSTAALSGVVIALVLQRSHAPTLLDAIFAAVAGALAGAVCGFINGVLVTRLKVVPFIVTLGSLLIVRAVAKGISHDSRVDAPENALNDLLAKLPAKDSWHILPLGAWITVLLAILMAFILKGTRFGRHVIAVGSNEAAAQLSGVRIDWVKVRIYAISGLFAGIAGLMQFSRITVGDPTVAVGLELDAIAAVVIGGASLSGGEGSIFGAIVGALIMQTIRNGGKQMGLPDWVQEILTGAIIILAVALDRWRARRASSKAE